ncbi:3-oxoacid CoA-transferase [Cetobacterium sp. 8H]|uniref:acyl CoA:acetate/3-ketoacid CoA transferase n=1 Tax=Cetobacterium sp. 8H TaxID=2759681 RepID=UPI00163B7F0A|nr:CoA-transferase [Cetobacterium sp. 8H]MBC2849937.1 3-oxoacid CoA-transferase [Cetobacterium sp. 8H]
MKFISAKEVAKKIENESIVATGGFVGIGVAEEVLTEMENHYLENKKPTNLTLIYAAGQGDGKGKGLNHLAHEGMVNKVIGGHWGLAPKLGNLALENKIQGYNLPQGVISHMFRDLASGKKGTISKIGIGTFVDPQLQGGKVNEITSEDIVKEIFIENERHLYFKAPSKIDFAILRGTLADEDGNISLEKEALTLESLALAMATKNSGGKVVVQVEKKVKNGSINPKLVGIPSIFVDYVVLCSDEKYHHQTFGTQYDETFVNSSILVNDVKEKSLLDERKIIARRCAMFLSKEDKVLNYGIGMPEGIAEVLRDGNQEHLFTPTVEPGAIGGTPAGGLSFGASVSPQAIIDQPYQFDFYDGGGLDVAFLGLAQCDSTGDINVSKFGPKIAGCGGFINISQNAKKVIFCGTFMAGGIKVQVTENGINILNEGKSKKFIKEVEQITFSSKTANLNNQPVFYVTERAVFKLSKGGLELIEIAPGIDLEKDIINNMEFRPIISENLKVMDKKIFQDNFKLDL